VLWKEYVARQSVTGQELAELAGVVKRILNLMEEPTVRCSERDVLDIARELKLTFYDASYVHCAATRGSTLVSEDAQLLKRAASRVRTQKLEEMLSGQ